MEEGNDNVKQIKVTAGNGVTTRIHFADYGDTDGTLGVPARYIEVRNIDAIDNSRVKVAINLYEGNIGTDYVTVRKGEESYKVDGRIDCVAYEGFGVDVLIEITIAW